jgi:aminopeptidase N
MLLASPAAIAAAQTSAPSDRTFDSPRRAYDYLRMRAELRFDQTDLEARRLQGVVQYRVRVRDDADDLDRSKLPLWAVNPEIRSIQIGPGWRDAAYQATDDQIIIDLDRPRAAGDEFDLRIDYSVTRPRKGLHFVAPDVDQPGRPWTVYSMSEPLQARYWIPCHDWPDTRWPMEVAITAPAPLSAVSVGAPANDPPPAPPGTPRTFVWRLDEPIDPHLLGFAVSEYESHSLPTEPGAPAALIHVQPGDAEAGRYTFRRVPEMLRFYEKLTGVPYPFPQCNHAAVPGHFHGGMEHAGFSMLAPSMLTTGPRGDVNEDVSQYNYIAHMLAHQWFAGITSYRHVREAWLNEGFGTYLHLNWYTQSDSPERFALEMDELIGRIARFDTAGNPLRPAELRNPDLVYSFDGGKVYWKGAWVLHMLRHELGEATFWEGVRGYLTAMRGRGATTEDLRAALEGVSGRDLGPFFEQWVLRGGVPKLRVEYEWDAVERSAIVRVIQRQAIDAERPAFELPLKLCFARLANREFRTAAVRQEREEFRFPLAEEPEFFCADPDGAVLTVIEERKDAAQWPRQAVAGPTVVARRRALEQLARQKEPAVDLRVLDHVARRSDEHWLVRRQALRMLASQADTDADRTATLSTLLEISRKPPAAPEFQAALVAALGEFPESAEAYAAVLARTEDAAHFLVQEAALKALGEFDASVRTPAADAALARAALRGQPRAVRNYALRQLREPGRAAAAREFLALALEQRPDDTERERRDAAEELLRTLSKLAADAEHAAVCEALILRYAADARPAVRRAAVRGLATLSSQTSAAQLARIAETDADPTVRAAARGVNDQADSRPAEEQ